jgi:hypothetical protein
MYRLELFLAFIGLTTFGIRSGHIRERIDYGIGDGLKCVHSINELFKKSFIYRECLHHLLLVKNLKYVEYV